MNGKPKLDKDAPPETVSSPHELDLIARAAGSVAEIDSPRPDNGRSAAISPSDGRNYPREEDGTSTGVVGAQTPEAA